MKSPDPKATLLIVDDAPVNIRLLSDILKGDHRILIATRGEEALRLAREKNPDLILLDVMMPEMDGYETCIALKKDPQTNKIPVIFVTAMDSKEDETHGLELGAIDYITKPSSPAIIRVRVRNHLELKRHRDTLERLSTMDGLTEIANRRSFDHMLDQEWRRGVRSNTPLTLMLMDVDFFKGYNDTYGHQAGDECLKAVASALRGSLLRATDFVARYGGEEFAVILPGLDVSGAQATGDKLRLSIENLAIPHERSQVSPHVTLSIGAISLIPQRTLEMGEILKIADRMLYQAKDQGRNRVCLAPAL